jgi:hypothetical protein
MNEHPTAAPKALFLSPDGNIYPDSLVCAGLISLELDGKPCPYSNHGRFPDPIPLNSNHPDFSLDKGKSGDLCPPCAKHQLGHLGHWQGYNNQTFPSDLLPLRLFKCRMWLWVVVPGLHDADSTRLQLEQSP